MCVSPTHLFVAHLIEHYKVTGSSVVAGNSEFATGLMSRVRRQLHELVVLGDHCLGEEAFMRFVQDQLVSEATELVLQRRSDHGSCALVA